MNGSCAGGTGAFIDQMATLLDTDASGLNDYAKDYKTLYPIASRCGVFAKTDLQPLINDGAAKPDLAASIFTAVATQTIAGLASGRPIRGTVIFLGGPLFFMSELREAFHRALAGKVDEFIVPTDAHLYVAYGSALIAGEPDGIDVDGVHFEPRTCDDIIAALDDLKNLPANTRDHAPAGSPPTRSARRSTSATIANTSTSARSKARKARTSSVSTRVRPPSRRRSSTTIARSYGPATPPTKAAR